MKKKNEKYDVFISYSHLDYLDEGDRIIPGNIVSKIKSLLNENNISYWLDEDGSYSGGEWPEILAKQIEDAKVFLFISTKNSNSSVWTSNEIAFAHDNNKRIIPFKYDKSKYNKKFALYIQRLDYIDYTKNHDKAFKKLISSIKEYLNESKPAVDTTELSKVRQEIQETEDRLRLIRNDISIQNARMENLKDYLNDLKIKEQKILAPDPQKHVPFIPTPVPKPSLPGMLNDSKESKGIVNATGTGYSNGMLRVKGIEYPMVYVAGGSFMMGSDDIDALSSEKPAHPVTLSSYSIGKYEVTQELWEAVMGNNPSHFKGARRPVENVSWDDCQEFIRKLNSLTGQNFCLPTEAQWEFAARGGNSDSNKYSGSNNIDNVAWYHDNSGGETHNVGTKSPNELGIHDMSGNVHEWCSDWYYSYESDSLCERLEHFSGSTWRVYRGGSWNNYAGHCRVSFRSNITPGNRSSILGLRLCLSPDSQMEK